MDEFEREATRLRLGRYVDTQAESRGAGTSRSELNPAIWSHLPFEFLCFILQRVPTDSLMRWRRVSKTWIPDFLATAERESSASGSPWLPRLGDPVPLYYIPVDNFSACARADASQNLTLVVSSFNKGRNSWQDVKMALDASHPQPLKFLGSHLITAGGILLLELTFKNFINVEEICITIFNPTTVTVRQLPPIPDARARIIGVIASRDGGSYTVVASGYAVGRGSTLFVYKSESRVWHYCGTAAERLEPIPPHSAVCIGDLLYFLFRTRETNRTVTNRFYAFDVVTETCQRWGSVPKHYGAGKPYLLEVGGSLTYIARTQWCLRGILYQCFRFFKLDPVSLEWVDVRDMPPDIEGQLARRIEPGHLRVSGAGNFIYFYGVQVPFQGPPYVLAHDYSAGTWYWLPHISSPLGNVRLPYMQEESLLISLQPSLLPV